MEDDFTEEDDVKASSMGRATGTGTNSGTGTGRIGLNPNDSNANAAGRASNIGTAVAGAVALTGIAIATYLGHETASNGSSSTTTDQYDPKCDSTPTVNMTSGGTYIYLGFHEQAGQCVASGATAELNSGAYARGMRPKLSFDLPGLDDLPSGNYARGHLIGYAMGGSNVDLRNFVPLYQSMNNTESKVMENPIVAALSAGGHEHVSVVPIYGDPDSPVPTGLVYNATGSYNKSCTFMNTPSGKNYWCS
jgi:hypothetical protein